jgi:hypothetical protein
VSRNRNVNKLPEQVGRHSLRHSLTLSVASLKRLIYTESWFFADLGENRGQETLTGRRGAFLEWPIFYSKSR